MRILKGAALTVVILALAYLSISGAVYAAMLQPPERFGAFMAHVPGMAMMFLPFRPLWMSARAGNLIVGDTAPDFELPTLDRSKTVRLSSEYSSKPVVLIFGSYT